MSRSAAASYGREGRRRETSPPAALDRPATQARVLEAEAQDRRLALPVGRRRVRAAEQRAAVRQPERLVEGEDRQVAVRSRGPLSGAGQPGLRGVLDEREPALVAPAPPAGRVLRQAEVVRQVQRPRALPDEALEDPSGASPSSQS